MGKAGMMSHVLFWKIRRKNHYFLQYGSQEKQLCGEKKISSIGTV